MDSGQNSTPNSNANSNPNSAPSANSSSSSGGTGAGWTSRSDRREKFWQHPLLTGVGGFLLGFLACLFWQTVFTHHFQFQHKTMSTPLPRSFVMPGMPQDGQDDSAGDDLPSDEAEQNNRPSTIDPRDPMAQMRRMQQQMMNQMFKQQLDDSADDDSVNPGDLGAGGISAPDFVRHEDDKYVYLELAVRGLNTKNLSVEVKDGVVLLNGSLDQKTDAGSEIHQSFQRQFSAPAGVNASKVEVEQRGPKLVLKFPKI